MHPTPRSTRRLLSITVLVLLLHGVVIGAVVRLLEQIPPQPPKLPPSAVLAAGRIEVVAAAGGIGAPAKASDGRVVADSRASQSPTVQGLPPSAPQRVPQSLPSNASQPSAHAVPVAAQAPGLVVPSALALDGQPKVISNPSDQTRSLGSTVAGAGANAVLAPRASGDSSAVSAPTPLAATKLAPAGATASSFEEPLQEADYLEPLPVTYPPQSRLRREQGRVVVKVLIGVDGRAQQTEVLTSSGYPRLDQAALASVRAGRFRPAQRGDAAQAAWYQVPVRFDLAP